MVWKRYPFKSCFVNTYIFHLVTSVNVGHRNGKNKNTKKKKENKCRERMALATCYRFTIFKSIDNISIHKLKHVKNHTIYAYDMISLSLSFSAYNLYIYFMELELWFMNYVHGASAYIGMGVEKFFHWIHTLMAEWVRVV